MKANTHADSWLFPEGFPFPVVSAEAHPLKLYSRRLLARAGLSAVMLHFLIFGSWLIQRALVTGVPLVPGFVEPYERPTIIYPLLPPSIVPDADRGDVVAPPETITPSAEGVPEPVEDFRAPDTSWKSAEEWTNQFPPVNPGDLPGGDERLFIDPAAEADAEPDPAGFQAVEEMPAAIHSPAPVYPEMARAAEVEGQVVVRALVNKEGRVEKAFVVSGHPMLDDAALAAVQNWIFQPGMQQHRPVKVWVNIPIRFVLR